MEFKATEAPNFDQALRLAGGWGRWQFGNLAKLSLCIGSIGICVMVWTFAAFDSPVRCAVPSGCEDDPVAAAHRPPVHLSDAVGDSCRVWAPEEVGMPMTCDEFMAEVREKSIRHNLLLYNFINSVEKFQPFQFSFKHLKLCFRILVVSFFLVHLTKFTYLR